MNEKSLISSNFSNSSNSSNSSNILNKLGIQSLLKKGILPTLYLGDSVVYGSEKSFSSFSPID